VPASVVAGFQFPLRVALLGRGRRRVGRDVGRAYSANTLGAVVGSLAGGFGLLPLLTAPGAWRAATSVLVALALAAAWLGRRREGPGRLAVPVALAAASLVLVAAPGPSAAWRHGGIGAGRAQTSDIRSTNEVEDWLRSERRALVWEADGVESSVALVTHQGLAFVINGKIDGHATVDAATQVMSGLLGAALQPQLPARALVIGLGTGSSAGWLAALAGVARVDVVELEPAVLEVARACRDVNRDAMRSPSVSISIGDAREVLLTSRETYDLVFSEPSNPYRAGIASLFTAEFYEAVAGRLSGDGVFVQWLQAYEVDPETVRSVYATLATRFAHVETWHTNRDLLLVARRAPRPPLEATALRARLASEPWRGALRDAWRVTDLEGFLARHVAGPAVAAALARSGRAPVNTDDRNRLEFGFARTLGRKGRFDVRDLLALAKRLGADRAAVAGEVDWAAVAEERQALLGAPDAELGPEAQARLRAAELAHADPRAALAAWYAQPAPPRRLRELLAVAAATAEAADERALAPLAAMLETQRAVEAAALRGIAAFRAGRDEAALAALVSAFEQARRDPWSFPPIVQRGIFAATELARRQPEAADALLAALSEPFAADALSDDRRTALLTIASRLPPDGRCLAALAGVEPHVPWRADVLGFRVRCYEAVAPQRAPLARADLARFLALEPGPLATGLEQP
jgi:spermidine synthase